MSVQKEFREFFLRHSQVNGGTKPDQEQGFITQYFVGTALKFNRFLKGDYPSENVFKKLFESITFKKNVEDTATTTVQGLVRSSTDDEARDRSSSINTVFTNVVRPHHLTDVVSNTISGGNDDVELSNTTNNGIKIDLVQRIVTGGFRKVFRLSIAVQNSIRINNSTKKLELVNDADTPGNNKVYGTDETGTKGWFDSCCVSKYGSLTGSVSGITEGYSIPMILGGSVPADLGTLVGDYLISLDVQIFTIADAFPSEIFNYGIAINGTPIYTKNFDGKNVGLGFINLSINDKITLISGNAAFFINMGKTVDLVFTRNIEDVLSGNFIVNKL